MMQQQQGGGGGGESQYGTSPPPLEMTPFAVDPITHQHPPQQLKLGDLSSSSTLVEEASPISSRPPAAAAPHSGSFEELILQGGGGGLGDEAALGGAAGDEIDRGGMGASGGNRWPRQETLALLKIRSEMDATFRDATLKGPLWEDVSRNMAELGYKRSAKKCKEKFENVHKYYKRTKEGRAGRQDGKSYRFFTQLEALHTSTAAPATTAFTSIANPMPLTSIRIPPSSATPPPLPPQVQASGQPPPPAPATISVSLFEPHPSAAATLPPVVPLRAAAPTSAPFEFSFSSDNASSSSGTEDDVEDEDEEIELESETTETLQRKRKRGSSSTSKQRSGSTSHRMMEFFEGLMKQVMQKQEAMQQRFLEAIEKREQDRMIREEAWKRQEMARLVREHDLMAQENAISASRDTAIIAFLQKITGQTIQLPQPVSIPSVPPAAAAAAPTPPPPQPTVSIPTQPSPSPPLPASSSQQQHPKPLQRQQTQHHQPTLQPRQQHEQQILPSSEVVKHQTPTSSEVVMAVPEQQVSPQELSGAGGSFEATSSRWPKAEVIDLITLRSGLESRYQEAGPKGPLWEEISEGMLRMGYKRSAKRCKEKWENINKYFKKVKESNKKRPEDAKTCPYFHQLDALYKKKILGSTSSAMGSGGSSSLAGTHQTRPDQEQQQQHESNSPMVMPSQQMEQTAEPENKNGGNVDLKTVNGGMTATLFGEGSQSAAGGAPKKPEDTVKDQRNQQQVTINGYGNVEAPDSDNIEQEEDDNYEDDEDDEDEETEEDMKMVYKIQFQRHSTGSSNGGGNGAPSYFAMVQ